MLQGKRIRRRSSVTPRKPWGVGKLAFEPLEPRTLLEAGPLLISEFMALNGETLPDGNGDYPDWIEIYNASEAPVNLAGWHLTDQDDDPTRWTFPPRTLDPGDYLVVFASGQAIDDYVDPQGNLHTNFELDGNGEYLALVMPDGTIAHEYAPRFPPQISDVSYGVPGATSAWDKLLDSGTGAVYHVPAAADAGLGTAWTALGFDDSSWDGREEPSRILITEVGTVSPDFVEIQNVSDKPVDTSGWVVALNHGLNAPINKVHPILWELPDTILPGQVLYRDDSAWGADIVWASSGPNWAMIIDNQGNVVDFIPWKYSTDDLAALDVVINGFEITVGEAWTGPSYYPSVRSGKSIQRKGFSDGNTAADWQVTTASEGTENADLTTPFTAAVHRGLGFSNSQPNPFDSDIQLDVGDAMHGVNASLWTRIEFEVESLEYYDELILRMKYDDGFAAYINGTKVAWKNAPETLAYDSAATGTRADYQAAVFEEIDISDALGLLRAGTNVLAIHGLNVSAGDGDFLILPELIATGTLQGPQYMISPSPREDNEKGALGRVADTNFSVDRGFYDEPFDVAITTSTAGATIRYTLDGTPPSESHGTVYTAPIHVDRTTTLRAVAYKPGYVPTNVDTQTYIFLDDVIRQDYQATLAAGFPTSWNGTAPDYGMDPDVIGTFHPTTGQPLGGDRYGGRYAATIREDLKSLPTLSIVMDIDDMFGSNGIYSHPTSRGSDWERPTSAELIYPDGRQGFQIDCGIRIQGGWFRQAGVKKHSLRLLFKGKYGPTKLDFPWFGEDAADRFDTITLRAGANDGYAWSSARYTEQYIRDEFGRSLQRAAGQAAPHGTFVTGDSTTPSNARIMPSRPATTEATRTSGTRCTTAAPPTGIRTPGAK